VNFPVFAPGTIAGRPESGHAPARLRRLRRRHHLADFGVMDLAARDPLEKAAQRGAHSVAEVERELLCRRRCGSRA
jgi:hypothetical protein